MYWKEGNSKWYHKKKSLPYNHTDSIHTPADLRISSGNVAFVMFLKCFFTEY